MKEKYIVNGMSCEACKMHVEKAVKKIDGVSSVSVNLITKEMVVESNSDLSNIINKEISKIGYNSHLKTDEKKEDIKDNETKKMIYILISSILFLIPLVYFSMGFMIGFPIGYFSDHLISLGLFLMILSFIIILINKRFYINAFKGIIHKSLTMDTLVALGSGVAFIYSVIILFLMANDIHNHELIHYYAMNLSFETAGMVPTLITIGKMLEAYSKGKTTNSLKRLMDLTPKMATIIKDDKELLIESNDLKIGDIFIVKPGEKIPTDAKIIDGNTTVDESLITGEAMPIYKKIGDNVIGASINKNGIIKCEVLKEVKNNTISEIINLIDNLNQTKPKIARLADKLSSVFIPVVILISLITLTFWLIISNIYTLDIKESNITYAISKAISVLVISCPCALGLATPVAIMVASGMSAKEGILFKNAKSIENLGKVKFVVLDKTGTITMGLPEVEYVKSYIDELEFLTLISSIEEKSSHPLSLAINKYVLDKPIIKKEVFEFDTLIGYGIKGIIDDKIIYGVNLEYAKGLIDIDINIINEIDNETKKGYTPLIFIYDNKLIGYVMVIDKIKEESKNLVKEFNDLGIIPIMLTGDNYNTSLYLANKLNIKYFKASLSPKEKGDIIVKLKKYGEVLMIGDGINDSYALSLADTSMAIGCGSDIAIDSADIILMKSSIKDAIYGIKLSRKTIKNIKENLFWALFYNLLMIPIAAGAFYFTNNEFLRELKPYYGAMAMSLSSLFVVLNALRLNLFNKSKKINKKKIINIDTNIIDDILKEENKNMELVLNVEGMMCKMCVKHVEEAALKVSGVKKAKASLDNKNVVIELDDINKKDLIIKEITNAGYEVK